jgi:pimeloyl-ACP methyl ester carboxylesterase
MNSMSAKTAVPPTEKPQIEKAEVANPNAEQPQSAADRLLTGLSVRRRTQIVAGVETAVLEGGDGPPLVLLHGPGEFAGVWSPVLGDLVRRHRVVAPDLPGHGASASPADGLSGEWVDHWLDDLITAYCPEPAVLVGRVVGGAIGAAYAAAHPDRLAQLVLVDSLGFAPFDPDPRFELAMLRFLAAPSIATYERFMDFCAFDLDTAKRRLGDRWIPYAAYAVDRAENPGVQSAIGSVIGLYGRPTPPAVLDAIRVPTSLIWGREDAATPLSVAERASARYGWPLHVIDRAGDDPALDRPAEFVSTLLEVLARGADHDEP